MEINEVRMEEKMKLNRRKRKWRELVVNGERKE
jgi:hypothetical protein